MTLKRVLLPNPPNPATVTQQADYNMQLYQWCLRVKGLVEDNSRINASPVLNGLVVGMYTPTTEIDNTMGTLQCADAICTIGDALTTFGLITPSTKS
jgi:hypothetical protein